MSKEYYDRYQRFKVDGGYTMIPFIKITPKQSDKTVVYHSQRTRMDKLSQQYYDNPYHGWLIMLANPQYGGVEENIPDNEIIRIPYPFRDSLQQYIEAVNEYERLYGES
tara:strand:- start:4996 stop:5322 length:327 start_codon:yes stop_codon:yes gene_type:complete